MLLKFYAKVKLENNIKIGDILACRLDDKIRRFEAFNNLVKRYDGEICFFIDPKCKWTLFNIENAKFKEGTKEVDEPTIAAIQKDPKLKFMIHPLDAVTYPAEYYWAIQ